MKNKNNIISAAVLAGLFVLSQASTTYAGTNAITLQEANQALAKFYHTKNAESAHRTATLADLDTFAWDQLHIPSKYISFQPGEYPYKWANVTGLNDGIHDKYITASDLNIFIQNLKDNQQGYTPLNNGIYQLQIPVHEQFSYTFRYKNVYNEPSLTTVSERQKATIGEYNIAKQVRFWKNGSYIYLSSPDFSEHTPFVISSSGSSMKRTDFQFSLDGGKTWSSGKFGEFLSFDSGEGGSLNAPSHVLIRSKSKDLYYGISWLNNTLGLDGLSDFDIKNTGSRGLTVISQSPAESDKENLHLGITRAEGIKNILNYFHIKPDPSGTSTFFDILNTNPLWGYVHKAIEMGVKPDSKDWFDNDYSLSQQDAAQLFYVAMDIPKSEPQYSGVGAQNWADAVNLFNHVDNGSFNNLFGNVKSIQTMVQNVKKSRSNVIQNKNGSFHITFSLKNTNAKVYLKNNPLPVNGKFHYAYSDVVSVVDQFMEGLVFTPNANGMHINIANSSIDSDFTINVLGKSYTGYDSDFIGGINIQAPSDQDVEFQITYPDPNSPSLMVDFLNFKVNYNSTTKQLIFSLIN